MLKLGYRYERKLRWIPTHLKLLKELKLDGMHREILDEYLSKLESLSIKIERFQSKLEKLSQEETSKK